ncbi:hypothetical protein pb186bvf_018923 [Paramecium bursaria]
MLLRLAKFSELNYIIQISNFKIKYQIKIKEVNPQYVLFCHILINLYDIF